MRLVRRRRLEASPAVVVVALDAAFDAELAGLLTTEQEARLLLFEPGFRQDLREVLRRLRSGGPGQPGRGPWAP